MSTAYLQHEDAIGKTWITAKIRDSGTLCAAFLSIFTRLSRDRVRWKAEIKEMNLKKKIIEKYYFFVEKNDFENFRNKYFWNFRKCPTLALINTNIGVN